MLARCRNPRSKSFHSYGGRGIRVCSRWVTDFAAFLADVGKRPTKGHSLDRIDNNGNYSCGHCEECVREGWPANCRWATALEQQSNTRRNVRLTHDGETLTISQWARRVGLPMKLLHNRIRVQRMSVSKALTLPLRKRSGVPKDKLKSTRAG